MGRLVVRSRPEFSARSGGRLYARLKMVRFGQSLLHRAKTCCECVLLSKVGRQYFFRPYFRPVPILSLVCCQFMP